MTWWHYKPSTHFADLLFFVFGAVDLVYYSFQGHHHALINLSYVALLLKIKPKHEFLRILTLSQEPLIPLTWIPGLTTRPSSEGWTEGADISSSNKNSFIESYRKTCLSWGKHCFLKAQNNNRHSIVNNNKTVLYGRNCTKVYRELKKPESKARLILGQHGELNWQAK